MIKKRKEAAPFRQEVVNADLATEIEELKAALRFAAGYISGTEHFKDKHPMEVYDWLLSRGRKIDPREIDEMIDEAIRRLEEE